jgi:chromosome segregation ATPase
MEKLTQVSMYSLQTITLSSASDHHDFSSALYGKDEWEQIKESSFLCPCPKVVHVVIMLKCFLLFISQELQATTAEKISAKAELEALQEEKLRLQREEDALKATVALAETERMLIKKQNDEAQEELKALDEELARQRRDNEEVVSALEEANSAAAQAALVTKELQLRLSETEDRWQFLEEEIVHLKSEAAAAKADLETRTCELQLVEKNLELARSECSSSRIENEEMGTLLSQKNATLEMLSVDMQNLETQFAAVKQELAVRVHELEEFVFKNSEEKLALLKKQELLQSTLSKVEGERDDLQKSCEVIQHDMNRLAKKMEQQETQLTDRISELVNENSEMEGLKHKLEMQQVELSEFETKLARANLEIDDQEKQLAAVHSILLENSKEQTLLQKNIEQLEAEKVRGPCRMLII